MGYRRRVCAEALKQSNNRLEEASEMLLTNIDMLITASDISKDDDNHIDDQEESVLPEDPTHIPQLIALGAEPEEARALLEIHGNRLDRAAEELLQRLKDSATATTTTSESDQLSDLLERARDVIEERGNENINMSFV